MDELFYWMVMGVGLVVGFTFGMIAGVGLAIHEYHGFNKFKEKS